MGPGGWPQVTESDEKHGSRLYLDRVLVSGGARGRRGPVADPNQIHKMFAKRRAPGPLRDPVRAAHLVALALRAAGGGASGGKQRLLAPIAVETNRVCCHYTHCGNVSDKQSPVITTLTAVVTNRVPLSLPSLP